MDKIKHVPALTILKIGHVLLQNWYIIHQCKLLATDNMEWTNMSSLIRVSLGQGSFNWERHCRQLYKAELEESIWKWILFWHLANRLDYWVGVTLFLMQQLFQMSYMLNFMQLFLTMQRAIQRHLRHEIKFITCFRTCGTIHLRSQRRALTTCIYRINAFRPQSPTSIDQNLVVCVAIDKLCYCRWALVVTAEQWGQWAERQMVVWLSASLKDSERGDWF